MDHGDDATPDSGPASRCDRANGVVAYVVTNGADIYAINPAMVAVTFVTALACPAAGASPSTMAVSRAGIAYVKYNNGKIYSVDLTTHVCKQTPYPGTQTAEPPLNLGDYAISVDLPERMVFVGTSGAERVLAQSDLSTFAASIVGQLPNDPSLDWLEFKFHDPGRLYGIEPAGTFVQIDPVTAQVVDSQATGFHAMDYAMLIYAGVTYLFGDTNEYQYDPASKVLKWVGPLPFSVLGAGSIPCGP
jgi:hypothetical protein